MTGILRGHWGLAQDTHRFIEQAKPENAERCKRSSADNAWRWAHRKQTAHEPEPDEFEPVEVGWGTVLGDALKGMGAR